jgi:hypothetical protein
MKENQETTLATLKAGQRLVHPTFSKETRKKKKKPSSLALEDLPHCQNDGPWFQLKDV